MLTERATVVATRMVAKAMAPARVNGDHLLAIREAVADEQHRLGFPELAGRIRAGECDQLPIMQAAIAAVERVLKGMFA